jgi:aarF domain-containing kinase
MTTLVKVAGVAGGSAIAVVAFMHYELGEDAPLRLLTAYKNAIPAFISYRYVQLRYDTGPRYIQKNAPQLASLLHIEPDHETASSYYTYLHKKWASPIFDDFLSLRGFYIKTGQLIATNVADASPEHWQEVFRPLLDKVPHKPFEQVKEIVEGELGGKKLSDVFEQFDERPIGAASIGQVHKAVLKKEFALSPSRRNVVVKVQYPEVEKQFRGDIFAAKSFCRIALPEHVPALSEIEKQFANEFDYRREAMHLDLVRSNLKRASPSFDHIQVPEPVESLCTKRILVMEEIPNAEKLSDVLERDMIDFAKMRNCSVKELMDSEKKLNEEALKKGVLRNGPSREEMNKLIFARRTFNTLTWPLQKLGLVQKKHVPLNHAYVIDELFRVHGHEIFIDGAFNGDPHPGNLLVSYPTAEKDGSNAKIALVDYGAVKILSFEQRKKLAMIILKLHDIEDPKNTPEEKEKLKRDVGLYMLNEMGFQTSKNDPTIAFLTASLYFDRDDKIATGGKHVQEYIDYLQSSDPVVKINDDYVLAVRAALMLRGLGHALNQHRGTVKEWLPFAQRVLKESQDYNKLS